MNMQIEKNSAVQDSPVAWFVVLERSRKENNFDVAARARHELERLGVIVKYRKVDKADKGNFKEKKNGLKKR